jgi:hypothetical protein
MAIEIAHRNLSMIDADDGPGALVTVAAPVAAAVVAGGISGPVLADAFDSVGWAAIITAAVVGLTGFVAAYLAGAKQWVEDYWKVKRRKLLRSGYAHGLERLAEFQAVYEQVKAMESVHRILLFVGQNGGGMPTAGKMYTVRAQVGWSKKWIDVVRENNFDYCIDAHYAALLRQMVDNGKAVVTVAAMPEGSALKALYRTEGVAQSILYFLDCDGAQLTFLAVANYEAEFTPDQQVKIEILVGRLRGLMAR